MPTSHEPSVNQKHAHQKGTTTMFKATVTRLFIGSLIALGAGFIAWIGAVLNTWQLESKAWFVALVLTGIFNFGFIAMVIYVIAGPDGKAARTAQPAGLPVGA